MQDTYVGTVCISVTVNKKAIDVIMTDGEEMFLTHHTVVFHTEHNSF